MFKNVETEHLESLKRNVQMCTRKKERSFQNNKLDLETKTKIRQVACSKGIRLWDSIRKSLCSRRKSSKVCFPEETDIQSDRRLTPFAVSLSALISDPIWMSTSLTDLAKPKTRNSKCAPL